MGFNVFLTLCVDLLHELELGIWKSVFIHLLRMLESVSQAQKYKMDVR